MINPLPQASNFNPYFSTPSARIPLQALIAPANSLSSPSLPPKCQFLIPFLTNLNRHLPLSTALNLRSSLQISFWINAKRRWRFKLKRRPAERYQLDRNMIDSYTLAICLQILPIKGLLKCLIWLCSWWSVIPSPAYQCYPLGSAKMDTMRLLNFALLKNALMGFSYLKSQYSVM